MKIVKYRYQTSTQNPVLKSDLDTTINTKKEIDRENMIKIANIGKKYKSNTIGSLIHEQMQSTISTLNDKD